MHSNAPDPNDLAHNTADLTAEEAAVLKPEEAVAPAANAPAAAAASTDDPSAPGAAAPAPAAVVASPADAGHPAASAVAVAAAEVPTAAPASAAPPPVFVPQLPVDARNYDEELKTVATSLLQLKQQLNDGEIEEAAYEAQYEALQDQKTTLKVSMQLAADRDRQNRESADQAWEYLQNQFFSDAANANIRANGILFAAFEGAMQEVADAAAREGRQVTDWQLLNDARGKLVEMNMLSGTGNAAGAAAPPPVAAARPPVPDRTAPLGAVPAQLSQLPTAADPGGRSNVEQLAELGSLELESRMANMSDAQIDQILRSTPGSVVSDAQS